VTPHPTRSNVKRTILIDFSTRMLSITGPYLTFSTAISITIPANEHILLCPIPEYNNQSHAVTPPVMPHSDPRQLVASEINCDSRFTGEISNKKNFEGPLSRSFSRFPWPKTASDTYKLDFRQRQQGLKDTPLSRAGIKSLKKISQIYNVACK